MTIEQLSLVEELRRQSGFETNLYISSLLSKAADAIETAVEKEREECAKIADKQTAVYEEAAAKAETSMNRTLNVLGASTCKMIAYEIRTRK